MNKIQITMDENSINYHPCPRCHGKRKAKISDIRIERDDDFDKFYIYAQNVCSCGCSFATRHEYKLESVISYNVM